MDFAIRVSNQIKETGETSFVIGLFWLDEQKIP